MPHRLQHTQLETQRPILATALRAVCKGGYSAADLRADILAGLVVGVVALPLSMALAIASGVPPQHGLYTAIVAGAVTATLGGSRVQVTGPTAAFVVILAPISHQYGVGGLCLATMMAGIMLCVAGFARLGRLIEFVPHPVTTGFTAGIAVVIATLQVKDFLGLRVSATPEHFHEKMLALRDALPTVHLPDLLIGALTLSFLLLWPRFIKRIPGPVAALPAAALLALGLGLVWPGFSVATIASRFPETGGIPQALPHFALPWLLPGPDGQALPLGMDLIRALLGSAFAICVLGGTESLLSAVVADGVTGDRHDPDGELVAQGLGNIAAPFFGGIAATGAIARTATNIRSGARSPLAAVTHSAFLLGAMLVLAPLLGYLPMAALAALLLLVAWNMSELKHALHIVRVAPRADVAVLLICFGLTVVFDMVVAVTAGVMLAALLFMRRMADLTGATLVSEGHAARESLPEGVLLYDIAGPLFFGAAQRAMSAIGAIGGRARLVILDLRDVPMIDATGLVCLESTLARLRSNGVFVILAGVAPGPLKVLARAGVARHHHDWLLVLRNFADAVTFARLAAGSDLSHMAAHAEAMRAKSR